MQGSPPLHHSPTLSSSSRSSTSSFSRSSLSPSLSPAHSIKSSNKVSHSKHHHHHHQRRPSPLKRQMSLGATSNDSSAPFDINPLRSHNAGPLAVLYSVEPDEDPLLVASVSRSPSKLGSNSLHSSPFNEVLDPPAPGTPRSVSALSALDRASGGLPAYPPASPNRSLLSAFQAVSPRLQSVTSRSSSAPSLSTLNNGNINSRTTSPRGPIPQSALGPASPISTSPRQSTHQRTSYATAAFRALNGATSPQKQVPSRSSSSSSAASTSNAASLNVSPVRSRSSSALRQVQNDFPTWQVYRDADAPAQSTSTGTLQPPASLSTNRQEDNEDDAFAIDEDREEDENDENCENDENSAPLAVQAENSAPTHIRSASNASPDLSARHASASGSGAHSHRRSSLSMSSLPRELAARERDVTPPPSASRWAGATQDEAIEGAEHDMPGTSVSGSATRARKRPRTSGEMSQ